MAVVAALCAACGDGPTQPTPGTKPPVLVATPSPTPEPFPLLPPPQAPSDPNAPSPPTGACPPEAWRGWGILRADWPGGFCVGWACDAQNKIGFPSPVVAIFDSTAHPKKGGPMPQSCVVKPSDWSIEPEPARFTKNDAHSMTAKLTSGTWTVSVSAEGVPVGEVGKVNVR